MHPSESLEFEIHRDLSRTSLMPRTGLFIIIADMGVCAQLSMKVTTTGVSGYVSRLLLGLEDNSDA